VPKTNKFPRSIIDHWPEIFNDVEIRAIPIKYLHAINVNFKDGNKWCIEMNKNKGSTVEELEESLEEFFNEHDDLIESVEFNLNTAKVKKDVQIHTKRFMKRRL